MMILSIILETKQIFVYTCAGWHIAAIDEQAVYFIMWQVDMLESLLKMKKDVDEKRGMAITYSYLLQLHGNFFRSRK